MEKIKNFLFKNQNTRQIVVKNTFWLFSSEIIGRLLKAGFLIYAIRILGKGGWGAFAYALSLVGIFMTFSDIGLSTIMTREESQNNSEKEKTISTIFYLKLFFLLISILMAIIFSSLLNRASEAKILLPIIVLILLSDSIKDFLFALNRGSQKMEREGYIKILAYGATAFLGFFFFSISPSSKNLAFAYLGGSVLGTMTLIFMIWPMFKKLWRNFSKEKAQSILATVWPIAILGGLSSILFNTDNFLLGWWKGMNDIGLYAADQKLVQLFFILPGLIGLAVFPVLSRLALENKEKFAILLEKILTMMFLLGLPIVLIGTIWQKEIISLVFGTEYMAGAKTFGILLFMIIPVFPATFLVNALFAINQQKKMVWPTFLGVIFNVLLNVLLIPRFGILGSAWATVVSQFIITYLNWIILKRFVYFSILPFMPKIVLTNLISIILIIFLKNFNINMIASMTIIIIAYFGILYLIKETTFREIKNILRLPDFLPKISRGPILDKCLKKLYRLFFLIFINQLFIHKKPIFEYLTSVNPTKLFIFSTAFNDQELIEFQYKALKKNLLNMYEYFVIDNSETEESANGIKTYCLNNNINYIRLPKNNAWGGISHGLALNWTYKNIIKRFNPLYFGFIDHDIFPIRPVKIQDHLISNHIWGIMIIKKTWLKLWKTQKFLWPGLAFFRSDKLQMNNLDFLPPFGLDTGGKINIDKYGVEKLSSLYDFNICEKIEISDDINVDQYGNWVHLRGTSKDSLKSSSVKQWLKNILEIF